MRGGRSRNCGLVTSRSEGFASLL